MGVHVVCASGASCGLFLTEVCIPLFLLCWLCWPGSEQDNSETSSNEGRPPKKPVLICESPCARRSSESCAGRAMSPFLHLPTTSGGGGSGMSSHRSHEEFRSKEGEGDVGEGGQGGEERYHSAPTVIYEVVHRRDWDTTHTHLYNSDDGNGSSSSPADREPPTCKKHNKNIKSTRHKEHDRHDVKETDTTETHFYIGDALRDTHIDNDVHVPDIERVLPRNKLVKQTINEFRKNKTAQERETDDVNDIERERDGAMHHCLDSSVSLRPCLSMVSHASVEPVGYGYCVPECEQQTAPLPPAGVLGGVRHSEGDILHHTHIRPQSGAFSESEVEVPTTKAPTINLSIQNKIETAV